MVTRTDLLVYTKLNHLLKVGEERQNNYLLGLPSDHGINVRSRENDHMMVKVLTMILIMLTMITMIALADDSKNNDCRPRLEGCRSLQKVPRSLLCG